LASPAVSCLPYLQGKLKSCSSQTGKFTLQYDDGQCEQLLLERERFIWHAPRGMTAGYKPALHSLMQALGAEGLKALPQDGPDGKTAPLTPRPEVTPGQGPGDRLAWNHQCLSSPACGMLVAACWSCCLLLLSVVMVLFCVSDAVPCCAVCVCPMAGCCSPAQHRLRRCGLASAAVLAS
jgi:hypothetical protein